LTRAIKVSTYEKVPRRQNKDNGKGWTFEMELSLVAHMLRECDGAGSNPILQFNIKFKIPEIYSHMG